VLSTVRRVVLHLSSGYPLRNLFTRLAARLIALPDAAIDPVGAAAGTG